jgi:hypothetical protein
VRFFLGFGLVGLGSVRCGSAMSSKMGLFQNGKDNWVGVISSFLRVFVLVEFYIGNRWLRRGCGWAECMAGCERT